MVNCMYLHMIEMNGDLDSELIKKKKKDRMLVIEIWRNTGWACAIYIHSVNLSTNLLND